MLCKRTGNNIKWCRNKSGKGMNAFTGQRMRTKTLDQESRRENISA